MGGAVSNPSNAPFVMSNTIVAGNSAQNGPDLYATTTGGGYNLVQNTAGAALFGTNITGQSPNLGALAENGGPTKTMAIGALRPAYNAGSDALIPGGVTTDQRGAGYPRIQDATVDIGAYEVVVAAQITGGRIASTTADTPQTSSLQLSGLSASASSIRITFTGIVSAASATDTTNHAVTSDGAAVPIETATVINGNTVVLDLPKGVAKPGDALTIRFNIRDSKGRVLAGVAKVAVR